MLNLKTQRNIFSLNVWNVPLLGVQSILWCVNRSYLGYLKMKAEMFVLISVLMRRVIDLLIISAESLGEMRPIKSTPADFFSSNWCTKARTSYSFIWEILICFLQQLGFIQLVSLPGSEDYVGQSDNISFEIFIECCSIVRLHIWRVRIEIIQTLPHFVFG